MLLVKNFITLDFVFVSRPQNSVVIATRLWSGLMVRFLAGASGSFIHSIQTGPVVDLTSCPVGIGCSLGGVAEVWRDSMPPTGASYAFMAWCLIQHRYTFTLCSLILLTRRHYFSLSQCCRNYGNYVLFHSACPLFCVFASTHTTLRSGQEFIWFYPRILLSFCQKKGHAFGLYLFVFILWCCNSCMYCQVLYGVMNLCNELGWFL
jgi:hypothetical protein